MFLDISGSWNDKYVCGDLGIVLYRVISGFAFSVAFRS